METFIKLLMDSIHTYKDLFWCCIIALIIIYFNMKNKFSNEIKEVIKEEVGKSIKKISRTPCISHDLIVKELSTIRGNLVQGANIHGWMMRHIYLLCAKNSISVAPEPHIDGKDGD